MPGVGDAPAPAAPSRSLRRRGRGKIASGLVLLGAALAAYVLRDELATKLAGLQPPIPSATSERSAPAPPVSEAGPLGDTASLVAAGTATNDAGEGEGARHASTKDASAKVSKPVPKPTAAPPDEP